MLFMVSTTTLADSGDFNLIDYLENHEVSSYSEFLNVIQENTGVLPVSMYTYSLTYVSDHEISFDVTIDYEKNIVEVDTVYETLPGTSTMATTSTRSGSAKHDTFSSVGTLIYTVTVNGTFSYTTTNCYTTSKSGSFTTGNVSLWSSTPSITSGSISSTKAYARISGTATFLWESSTYRLTLMCDTNGTLTSTFTRP